MRGAERMVNWSSGEAVEDNRSESLGVVRRGAMAPHWPSNRVYFFPVPEGFGTLCPIGNGLYQPVIQPMKQINVQYHIYGYCAFSH